MMRLPLHPATLVGVTAISVAISMMACDPAPKATAPAASSLPAQAARSAPPRITANVPMASAIPVPAASVEASTNPRKLPPYSGPTGVIEGVVRMRGDLPGDVTLKLTEACSKAQETYGKVFREGKGRTVADVLVAVTGYDAYVPPKSGSVRVEVRDCAYDRRTIAVTYGQRITVFDTDDEDSYLPVLLGENTPAQLVVTPGNKDGVPLFPRQVGHTFLADGMNRRWMAADVFVLKYATHAVTDLEGRYRIEGIPVGEVRIDALLPPINATVGRSVKVQEGKATRVDLELTYDEKAAKAAASASASAAVPPVPVAK